MKVGNLHMGLNRKGQSPIICNILSNVKLRLISTSITLRRNTNEDEKYALFFK